MIGCFHLGSVAQTPEGDKYCRWCGDIEQVEEEPAKAWESMYGRLY